MNKLRLLTGAALLRLGTYAGTATAGVDVHIGVGVPGTVYYDGWAPSYHEHYYSPRPVYRYYETWSTPRHDRWAYHHPRHHYRGHYDHRDRHHRHHRHHRNHRDHKWRDSHRRRYRD